MLVVRVDTTQSTDIDNGTASEKIKFFINGPDTSYNVDKEVLILLLQVLLICITIGSNTIIMDYAFEIFSTMGILADGHSYAPTDFAESKNGVWIPKDLS